MLAVGFIMDDEEVSLAISGKYGMIGSDGILNRGNGHPRAAGTFRGYWENTYGKKKRCR